MRKQLFLISALAAVGFGAWLVTTVAQSQTYTNSIYWTEAEAVKYTINYDPGTNFLTLSNRQSVQIHNCVVIRNVTDAEWAALTNHYPCSTQTYVFYGNWPKVEARQSAPTTETRIGK